MKLKLDWSQYENAGQGDAYADIPKTGGDYAKAIAVCIGSQQCQRPSKGVMCPSYRISADPLLSPGGRVKLLKAALNHPNAASLFNAETQQALDLCVSCKGCKRECENEVDMAAIKAEYLAQYYATHRLPLRRKLFAALPKLLAQPWAAPGIRLRNRWPWLARLLEQTLGLSAAPYWPEPQPAAFTAPAANPNGVAVVLFIDTFTRHFQPQAASAAITLLQQAGYQVHLINNNAENSVCCGRSHYANGQIDAARRLAAQLVETLLPFAQAGTPIIGLEPSCILSLRDEYLKLGFGEAAKLIAARTQLLEEFIAHEQTAGRLRLPFSAPAQQLLVHGHCWQKATGAMKSMRKVLKSVAGLEFSLIESSCCGMAGQFGLEAEHRDISQQMAEAALYPALRQQPHAAVIANGFSCQQQILSGGFAPPQHIAEFLVTATAPAPEQS
jgi:glycerol-3-phosphate dehydrogenase subunit C